eukprot:1536479-Pleurochrysis_carterae.AAC.3
MKDGSVRSSLQHAAYIPAGPQLPVRGCPCLNHNTAVAASAAARPELPTPPAPLCFGGPVAASAVTLPRRRPADALLTDAHLLLPRLSASTVSVAWAPTFCAAASPRLSLSRDTPRET